MEVLGPQEMAKVSSMRSSRRRCDIGQGNLDGSWRDLNMVIHIS